MKGRVPPLNGRGTWTSRTFHGCEWGRALYTSDPSCSISSSVGHWQSGTGGPTGSRWGSQGGPEVRHPAVLHVHSRAPRVQLAARGGDGLVQDHLRRDSRPARLRTGAHEVPCGCRPRARAPVGRPLARSPTTRRPRHRLSGAKRGEAAQKALL